MDTCRVGIIGLGRMGSTIDDEGHNDLPYSIAASCNASERLEVVCAADLLAERRDTFGKRWGVTAMYQDYRQMVEKERPDLVAVCTTASGLQKPAREAPDTSFRGDSHAELTVALAELDVPMVYMEKAMASSPGAADAARAACEQHGTVFTTGVLRRFDNRYEAAREAIAAGAIGEPRSAVHFASTNLMHGHVHSIDTLSYLLSDPQIEAVRGELLPGEWRFTDNQISSDPNAVYQLRFAGGVTAWSVPTGNWEFEVLGTEGSLRLQNNGSGALLRTKSGEGRRPAWQPASFEVPVARSTVVTCLEDLVDAHAGGRATRSPIAHSCHVVEACVAVAESHRQGGTWVELPLSERELYVFHV